MSEADREKARRLMPVILIVASLTLAAVAVIMLFGS